MPSNQWLSGTDQDGIQNHMGDAAGPMGVTSHYAVHPRPLQELADVKKLAAAQNSGEPSISLEPELKKIKTEQKLVRDEMASLQTQCTQLASEVEALNKTPPYIIRKKAHHPNPREKDLPPVHWATSCGWRYGCSRFARSAAAESLCRKCFPDEGADLASSGEHSQSSSSSSHD